MSGAGGRETVGVLGGTFDPVHVGHLQIADEARERLGLSRTLLVPAARPPHKPQPELSPARHRLAMLRLAIEGRQGVEISMLELERSAVGYTIDTLRLIRDGVPSLDPVFIMGLDSLEQIATWRDWTELLAEFDLAVIDRSEEGAADAPLCAEVTRRLVQLTDAAARDLRDPGRGGRIFRLPLRPIPVSSSRIRELAGSGRDITGLVPPSVARYIQRTGLYTEEAHP
jgi:nicotinate-nucleotide adenylyltransferase